MMFGVLLTEMRGKMKRSSDHLREALNVVVSNDEKGRPVLIPKKKLVMIGVHKKGEKGFRLRTA